MTFSPLDELAPAVAALVRAFLVDDASVTVGRVLLPTPDVAVFRMDGRVLVLADERAPAEEVEKVVQLAEQATDPTHGGDPLAENLMEVFPDGRAGAPLSG